MIEVDQKRTNCRQRIYSVSSKWSLLLISALVVLMMQRCIPERPANSATLDGPVDGLSDAEMQLHVNGDEAFNRTFTASGGLGPIFVQNACASCHLEDNRGHASTRLIRFGQSDTTGNQFLELGGPQLQNLALPGYAAETVPPGATSSSFIAPIVGGVGFLEAISDQTLLLLADPNDENGDGISGRINWVHVPDFISPTANAISDNGKWIGRFGRKASTHNLLQQTVTAYNQDMGIASTYLPSQPVNHTDGADPALSVDPEATDLEVKANVFYVRTVKAPARRNESNADVIRGEQLFGEIGCTSCHLPSVVTGDSPVEALSHKTIHPFTDLLLHDMGAELDDHYTEGSALTSEWRTTPLWGLGLAKQAQGGVYRLMHDGRATSLEQAISLHGGEGSSSRSRFDTLSESDKKKIILFLESL
jgi:CxxC motif-containing protein (DUF1111 family)